MPLHGGPAHPARSAGFSSALPSWLGRMFEISGIGLVAWELLRVAVRAIPLQWDFRVYRAAARAALSGLDPYKLEDLGRALGRGVSLPFLYPPIGLAPFLPFAFLPDRAAATIWVVLKVLCVAALVLVWGRVFARNTNWLWIALVAVFGSGAAALADVRSGNVGLIEAILIWIGLVAYVGGRRRAFALCVVAASIFKLAPAAFLLLLLVPTRDQPSRPRLFAGSLALVLALVFAPLAFTHALGWGSFLAGLGGSVPIGESNPSFLGLAENYLRPYWPGTGGRPGASLIVWAVVDAIVIAASVPWLRAAWREGDARRWAAGAVLLYLILSPRPMSYGYVLAGGALFVFVPPGLERPLGIGLYAILLSAQGLLRAASMPPTSIMGTHGPLWALVAVWGIEIVRAARAPGWYSRPPRAAHPSSAFEP